MSADKEIAVSAPGKSTSVTPPGLSAPLTSQREVPAQTVVLQSPKLPVQVQVTDTPRDYVGFGVSVLVALVTGALGAATIVWQVGKQRSDALDQQRLNVKAGLRLDAYRDFQDALRAYNNVASAASTEIRLIKIAMDNAVARTNARMPQLPMMYRARTFNDQLAACTSAAIGLIFFLERYQSLLPGFDMFKVALSCALYDISTQRPALDNTLLSWLPIDHPNPVQNHGPYLQLPLVTAAAVAEFDQNSEPVATALSKLQVWILDLSTDAQSFLLGDYADAPIRRRVPLDQTYFTVTSDPQDRDRLRGLFENTPYWRSNNAAIQQAEQQFGGEGQAMLP